MGRKPRASAATSGPAPVSPGSSRRSSASATTPATSGACSKNCAGRPRCRSGGPSSATKKPSGTGATRSGPTCNGGHGASGCATIDGDEIRARSLPVPRRVRRFPQVGRDARACSRGTARGHRGTDGDRGCSRRGDERRRRRGGRQCNRARDDRTCRQDERTRGHAAQDARAPEERAHGRPVCGRRVAPATIRITASLIAN